MGPGDLAGRVSAFLYEVPVLSGFVDINLVLRGYVLGRYLVDSSGFPVLSGFLEETLVLSRFFKNFPYLVEFESKVLPLG